MKAINRHGILMGLLVLLFTVPGPSAKAEDVDFLELAALMLRDGNLDRAIVALDQAPVDEEGFDLLRYYTLRGMTHLRRNEPEPAAEIGRAHV